MAWKNSVRISPRRSPRKYPDISDAYSDARALFISICSGNGGTPCSLDEGLRIFTDAVEKRMQDYEGVTTELLNILWKSHSTSSYLERQLRTSTAIVSLIRCTTDQTTIDDIANQLFEHFNVPVTDRQAHEDVARHLVFAAIGWSTMLYTATLTSASDDLLVKKGFRATPILGEHHVAYSFRRPVGAMLRAYGLMPIACPPGVGRHQGLPTLLSVTHLNFCSLLQLGDVTISWVDDLSKHCEFDRYCRNKELKLFRLPSICAKICLNQNDEILIGRLFRSHTCSQNCRSTSETVPRSYLIEVLLSYRLLFGQHRRSRQLFHERERENAKVDGKLDPLLDALCSDKGMDDFSSTNELLRERGVYNADVNFPHLGARLMELADYSISQRPRNLVEVWNDERDPERLLTFRAVIVIGIVGSVLGILQILVGMAQVVVSLKS